MYLDQISFEMYFGPKSLKLCTLAQFCKALGYFYPRSMEYMVVCSLGQMCGALL